jgi:hypothetical protein
MGEINNAYAQEIGLTYSHRKVKRYPLPPSQNRSQLGVPLQPVLKQLRSRIYYGCQRDNPIEDGLDM